MNKRLAKKLAETVTPEDLKKMFQNVQENFKEWQATSALNERATKGTIFNILTAGDDFEKSCASPQIRTNMIREFGDFLPPEVLPLKVPASKPQSTTRAQRHEEPKFKAWR